MSLTRKIVLNPETQDHIYTELCSRMEKQEVFVTCGNCDDKWIIGKWEDEVDFLVWCVAMGMATLVEPPTSSNSNMERYVQ